MYKIVIPSYNKELTLNTKTLPMLSRQHVPKNKIFIFVVEEEYEKYKKILDKNLYNKIIIGKKGLVNQLNFIKDYFNEGDKLVRIDDDISQVFKKRHTKADYIDKKITRAQLNEIDEINLDEFIKQGFNDINKHKITLFGINNCANPFLMGDNASLDLRLINGCFQGFINKKGDEYKYKLAKNSGQDIENTLLRFINDGAVLRYNNYSLKFEFFKEGGGLTTDKNQRLKDIIEVNKLFEKHYPEYGKIKKDKKQGQVFKLTRSAGSRNRFKKRMI